jgi:hypothetical protein
MLHMLGKLVYPLFGALVLGGYAYSVRRGIEPFEVSSDKRELPQAARAAQGGGYRRTPTAVFWYGGFGGK